MGLELEATCVTGSRCNQLNYARASLNQEQTAVSVWMSNGRWFSR